MQPYEKCPKNFALNAICLPTCETFRQLIQKRVLVELGNCESNRPLYAQFAEVLFAVCCFVQKWKLHRADSHNDNPNVLNSKQISERMIKMMNIARGKLEPGYCVFTRVISLTEISNFSHQVAPLALPARVTSVKSDNHDRKKVRYADPCLDRTPGTPGSDKMTRCTMR